MLALSSRTAERVRIARELHDVLGHHLTGLSLHLEVARHVAGEPAREPLGKAQEATKKLLQEVRDVVSALREEHAVDLGEALQAVVAHVDRPRVHLELPRDLELDDPALANTVLRCAQEIVTNAIRHARADNLWIDVVRENGGLILSARDDGRAADPITPGNGLRGMRERVEAAGGRLEYGAGSSGFRLTASLPVPEGR